MPNEKNVRAPLGRGRRTPNAILKKLLAADEETRQAIHADLSDIERAQLKKHSENYVAAVKSAAAWREEQRVGRRIWELTWESHSRLRLLRVLVDRYATNLAQMEGEEAAGRRDALAKFADALDSFLPEVVRMRGGADIAAPVGYPFGIDAAVLMENVVAKFGLTMEEAEDVVGVGRNYLKSARQYLGRKSANFVTCFVCGRDEEHAKKLEGWVVTDGNHECPDCQQVWRTIE
jgi:hypothetical protein